MPTIVKPVSEQQRAKRHQALAGAIANLRVENLHLDEECRRIFQLHVDGEITFDEFRAAIEELTNYRLKPVDSFATESRSAAEAA